MSVAVKSAAAVAALLLATSPAFALTAGEVADMPPHIRRAWVFGAADFAAHMFGRLKDKERADCVARWRGEKWNYNETQARLLEKIAIDLAASRLAQEEIDRELAENERKRKEMLDSAARIGGGTSAQARPSKGGHAGEPPDGRPADGKARRDDSHSAIMDFRAHRKLPASAVIEALMTEECGEYR